MGAAGAFVIPLLAFYFPLGGGIASAARILAAVASPGSPYGGQRSRSSPACWR